MAYRIRENFKIKYRRDPVSGHEWPEHGPTTSYSVLWYGIEIYRTKTLKRAVELKEQHEQLS